MLIAKFARKLIVFHVFLYECVFDFIFRLSSNVNTFVYTQKIVNESISKEIYLEDIHFSTWLNDIKNLVGNSYVGASRVSKIKDEKL